MVVIPDHLIFLATPRTGSRAIAAALMTVRGAKEHKEHHVHPDDVESSAESLIEGSSGLPRISVIRDPYEQVLSVFNHALTRHITGRAVTEEDLLRFVDEAHLSWWFDKELYPYKHVADSYLYEPHLQHTMNKIAYHRGLYPCPVVPLVGKTENRHEHVLTELTRERINERFKDDVEFYNQLRQGSSL